jgi:hypothetical protein
MDTHSFPRDLPPPRAMIGVIGTAVKCCAEVVIHLELVRRVSP